uniref:Uncharacterized protein n=1 Tax=Alexandrium monilatum TaxID=311494 RepID=A0A7S4QAV5_9DINO|mmetsp:Transcript_106583/g.318529  ORF Transcript_106583/g.318529 Transcript_106583/m.318529 type:complete len:244 (+) Transcript_106583:78-809(+)
MLLNSESFYTDGPPPQEVVDKRWLWKVYSAMLAMVFAVRIAGGDVAGAVLSGLMLCFVMVMLRDGMVHMSQYLVAYGILCILNLVLDIVPLVSALGGRVTRKVEPVMTRNEHGVQQMTYMLIKRTTPFFCSEGVIYNMQSLAMLLSPVTMLLGVVLAFLAHLAFSRQAAQEGVTVHSRPGQVQEALAAVRRMDGGEATLRSMQGAMQGVAQSAPLAGGNHGRRPADPTGRESYERFTGRSYKL